MTWAISWLALNDTRQEYKDARRLLVSFHERYGDEITFIPGGYFAPMFDTREHIRETIHKALRLISEMVGNGYRPQCLVAVSYTHLVVSIHAWRASSTSRAITRTPSPCRATWSAIGLAARSEVVNTKQTLPCWTT